MSSRTKKEKAQHIIELLEFYHRSNPSKEEMVELLSSFMEDDVIDLDKIVMASVEPKTVKVLLNGEMNDCFLDRYYYEPIYGRGGGFSVNMKFKRCEE